MYMIPGHRGPIVPSPPWTSPHPPSHEPPLDLISILSLLPKKEFFESLTPHTPHKCAHAHRLLTPSTAMPHSETAPAAAHPNGPHLPFPTLEQPLGHPIEFFDTPPSCRAHRFVNVKTTAGISPTSAIATASTTPVGLAPTTTRPGRHLRVRSGRSSSRRSRRPPRPRSRPQSTPKSNSSSRRGYRSSGSRSTRGTPRSPRRMP